MTFFIVLLLWMIGWQLEKIAGSLIKIANFLEWAAEKEGYINPKKGAKNIDE